MIDFLINNFVAYTGIELKGFGDFLGLNVRAIVHS